MINDKSNMGRKQIYDELPLPDKVDKGLFPEFTYKGIFIIVKLLLDIRSNLVKISEGRVIKPKGRHNQTFSKKQVKKTEEEKPDNPIKGLDTIKLTEGKTKSNTKEPKNSPPPVDPPDVEKKDKENEETT